MTCKDCVHYERCKWNADTLRDAGLLVDFTDDDESASERCIFFKNKANFVELPCKVGDTIYVITTKRPCFACCFCTDFCHKDCNFDDRQELIVKKATVRSIEIAEKCEVHMIIEGDETVQEYKYTCWFEDFDKTVFLTKEEAEQALKEGVQE